MYSNQRLMRSFVATCLVTIVTALPITAFANKPAVSQSYQTVEWIDLIPQDDLDALMNPPEYLADVEDGSAQDVIGSELKNQTSNSSTDNSNTEWDRYQQALVSAQVVAEFDNQPIRIPGFIVPLEFGDNQKITQFFLVPYFGACIHMPPPPPNQIVFVDFPTGLELEELYTPFWISGVLKTQTVDNDLAMSAYSMQMHSFEVYTE